MNAKTPKLALLLILLAVPLAIGTHTDADNVLPLTTFSSCPTPETTSATLTAGNTYVAVIGGERTSGRMKSAIEYAANDTEFLVIGSDGRVNPAAYFTAFGKPQPSAQVNPTLLRHRNLSSTQWLAEVKFTAPTGAGAIEWNCGDDEAQNGAGKKSYASWDNAGEASASAMDAFFASLVCSAGGCTGITGGFIFTFTSQDGPGTPATLSGSMNGCIASLSWTAAPGTREYYVNRTPGGTIARTAALSYRDVSAPSFGSYLYTVTAVSTSGSFGPASNALNLTCSRGTNLFADDGPLLGGNVAELSSGLLGSRSDASVRATRFLWGALTLLAVAGPIAFLVSPVAGGVAAVGIIVLLAVVGWWPAWLVAFIGVAGVVGIYAFARKGASA